MGTLKSKVIYEDEKVTLYGVVEPDGRFFLHSKMVGAEKPSSVRRYREILAELRKQLGDRGYSEFYTMADSVNSFRYNELLGFETNEEVWNDKFEVMVMRF